MRLYQRFLWTCVLCALAELTNAGHEHLFFSGYLRKGSLKALQIFNPTNETIDFDVNDGYYFVIGDVVNPNNPTFECADASCTDGYKTKVSLSGENNIEPGKTLVISYRTTREGGEALNALGPTDSGMLRITGSRWVALIKEESGGVKTVLDVIGDLSTEGPWTSSDSTVDTDNSAITRKSSSSHNYPAADVSTYTWNIDDWEQAIPPEEISTSDFDFFKSHFSDEFTCRLNRDCPDGVFCYVEEICKPCAFCTSDEDASLGACTLYCSSSTPGCDVTIPITSECPVCSLQKSFPDTSFPILEASR
ncbi:hypothetical protein TrLO_g6024 [Triparma laevis f. longispina]|uniref:Uncharacterized protein n=1 Tax=Triparma laevis f. longispina TaxID=1714387 RepID=A0A9W7FT42_9STRA|nr:hypothetical protein TrLO_g6024 [Triparma laevis f. longispina]